MRLFPIDQQERPASTGITWDEAGRTHAAQWWTTNERPAPNKVVAVDDRCTADQAIKYAAQGTAMMWLGDFHNAKQLLGAMDRRIASGANRGKGREKGSGQVVGKNSPQTGAQPSPADQFYRIRQARAQRSRMLSMLLVPLSFDEAEQEMMVPLPRAPRVGPSISFAYDEQSRLESASPASVSAAISLQELTGVQSAHQWFLSGVDVPILGAKIFPRYGTFLPTRQEYVDLVARAPMGDVPLAFDIGTGTGVLAAVLVKRGVRQVIGTDIHQRAVDCALDNFARLGMQAQASAELRSMFPKGRANLILCNPPWIPGSAASALDAAIYDPGSTMLLQFLAGLPAHLTPAGEGWLIISDLAELLGLRTREMLLNAIAQAGLEVVDRLDTVPSHGRVSDTSDVLHEARSREITSLWRLRVKTD